MKYIDEFRNRTLIRKLSDGIKEIAPHHNLNIMEVCGTHTQSFCRFGLEEFLPENIRLISGPGCPVCVSTQEYIDCAIKLARDKDKIIVTFGDMLRIPGTDSSLEKERARGAEVLVVYSALDSLKIARNNPSKKIIFLAVGFETTAPTIALSIVSAKKEKLKNLYFLSALKLIPPAMKHLAGEPGLNLSGFLCPGHVSAVIGTRAYEDISQRYKIPCCVTGFEPLDILEGIYLLLKQIVAHKHDTVNQYIRIVKRDGNPKAKNIIHEVFKVSADCWRGLGRMPGSGLKIKDKYSRFDADKIFPLSKSNSMKAQEKNNCRCGDVLKGVIYPSECPLFSKVCCPDNPIGPCMVSNEGACNAYFKYKR